jgi:hypothetical protein
MRAICGILVLALASGCTAERSARALFADVAGSSAESCGMVPLRQDPAQAKKCVEEALGSRKPFYVGLQVHGIDSQIWLGLARPRGGEVWALRYDSDVLGADVPLLRRPHLAQYPCPQPRFEPDKSGIFLRCE